MKKLTLSILSLIFLMCAAVGLVGCKNSDSQGGQSSQGEQNNKPMGLELQSTIFNIDSANKSGYLKVANSVTDYDFSDKFIVADCAKFDVCTDKQCNDKISSKRTDLDEGDNVFYILVTNGNDIASYTVTLRRRPIYIVTFDTNGGTAIENQQVEEDYCATEPTATRKGYNFVKWDYDFSTPISKNETIIARWNIITYKITYELNGGENAESNPTAYTIEDNTILSLPTKIGYTGSWNNAGKIEKGSVGNITFTASWSADVKLSIDGLTVIGHNNSVSDLVILSEYNGVQVIKIGNSAFSGCSGLTSITIPDSVTSIGSSAFSGCSGLTNVTIPDSVTSIGDSAFRDCSGLTSITIPNSVTSIGSSAFSGCSGLTNVTIPDSVTSIGDSAFRDCSGLTSITIPDSVTSIGDSAFSGCSGLTNVTIPDSVTSIGNGAFGYCSGLTSITIPDSVTSIGGYAFRGCSGLTSIEFKGTKAQWNAVVKGSDWNYNTGKYTVYCTDGTISK